MKGGRCFTPKGGRGNGVELVMGWGWEVPWVELREFVCVMFEFVGVEAVVW